MSDTNPSSMPPANDPMSFMKNLWGAAMPAAMPALTAFSFDTKDIEKRIQDLKAVEGWLRMNLSMLQVTIQGLEMQLTTLMTMQNMNQNAPQHSQAETTTPNPSGESKPWPWNLVPSPLQAMSLTPSPNTPLTPNTSPAAENRTQKTTQARKKPRKAEPRAKPTK